MQTLTEENLNMLVVNNKAPVRTKYTFRKSFLEVKENKRNVLSKDRGGWHWLSVAGKNMNILFSLAK